MLWLLFSIDLYYLRKCVPIRLCIYELGKEVLFLVEVIEISVTVMLYYASNLIGTSNQPLLKKSS